MCSVRDCAEWDPMVSLAAEARFEHRPDKVDISRMLDFSIQDAAARRKDRITSTFHYLRAFGYID
jgi:hypothetical protein